MEDVRSNVKSLAQFNFVMNWCNGNKVIGK